MNNPPISEVHYDEIAQGMFFREHEEDAEGAMLELAWLDPAIREFWMQRAKAVALDVWVRLP